MGHDSGFEDISFAFQQASRCFALAKQCSDDEISDTLWHLGQAFADYARRHSAAPAPFARLAETHEA
jgi:hypothetical protein